MRMNGVRSLQALFCAAVLFFGMAASVGAEETAEFEETAQPAGEENDELKIVSQPYTVSANYPDEVRMHVEVNHPELVKSYKWEMSDGVHVYELSGTSAATDTLVIPSTEWSMDDMIFNCIITDINDRRIFTEDISFSIANPYEVIPVVYVSEYALRVGESLDLSTVNLGTGTIRFNSADDITFDNVQFSNSSPNIYDDTLVPSTGILYEARYQDPGDYHLNFIGDCVIENTYFDPSINSAGVALSVHFNTDEYDEHPVLIFEGEGSLTAIGGQRIITTDAAVEIRNELNTETYEDRYSDALHAWSVELAETAKVHLRCLGLGISTGSDLIVNDGAELAIEAVSPHVSIGPSAVSAITAGGEVRFGKANVSISCHGDPQQIVPYGRIISAFHALKSDGNITVSGTDLAIELSADPCEKQYAYNFHGISGDLFHEAALTVKNGAHVKIHSDCQEIFTSNGIYAPGGINIEDGSIVCVDLKVNGEVYGLRTETQLNVKDSTADISALSGSDEERNYGIWCNLAEIELSDCSSYLSARAANGPAIVAGIESEPDGPREYEENHVPYRLMVNETAELVIPENGEISSWGLPYGLNIQPAETVYTAEDKETPAFEVKFAGPHIYGEPVYIWNEDFTAVTAEAICENDPSHIISEIAEVTSEITREPSAAEEGEITYTAVFANPAFETQVRSEIIPAEKEEVSYTILSGDNGIYAKGSHDNLIFRIGRTPDDQKAFSLFTGIRVDGKEVDRKFYTAAEGSVIITLRAQYLETLKAGKHTLTAGFEDGSAEASFTIQASSAPDTSDDNSSAVWRGWLIMSAAAAMGTFILRRKFIR